MSRSSSILASIRGLPQLYWYVWFGQLVNRVGGFVTPFLALYLTQERGMTLAQAGGVVSLYGAGSLLAGPVGGLLADKLGRRVTLVGALAVSALLMLGLGFARHPALIGVVTFLMGFATDNYRPAVFAIVADIVPPEDRLRAYAHLYWVSNVGFSVATVIAGLMASRSYLALFIADAATTLAFAALVALKVPETRDPARAGPSAARHSWQDVTLAFRDPVFMSFLAMTFPLGLVFFQFQMALPIDMGAHGASPAQYGKVIALNGLLIVGLQPFALTWLRRFRRSRVLAAAGILVGVGFGLNAVAREVWQYAVAVGIWTLGEIAHAPTSSSLVADLAPAEGRGRYQGAFFMTWGLASTLAPLLGQAGLERYGAGLWSACFGLGLLVAVGQLAIAGPRRRRLQAERAELAMQAAD